MISREICCRVLQKALSTGGDYAEIFAENTIKIKSIGISVKNYLVPILFSEIIYLYFQ